MPSDHLAKDDDDFEEDTLFDQAGLLTNKIKKHADSHSNHNTMRITPMKTFALCLAFFGLGISFSILEPTLLDLQYLAQTDTQQIFYVLVARSVGNILGLILGMVLFDRYNRQFLLFLSLLAMTIFLAILPWCNNLVAYIVISLILGALMQLLYAGGNVLCLDLWGRQSGPFLQAIHFSLSVGLFVAPLLSNTITAGKTGLTVIDSSSRVTLNNTFMIALPASALYSVHFKFPALQNRHRRSILTNESFHLTFDNPAYNVSANYLPAAPIAVNISNGFNDSFINHSSDYHQPNVTGQTTLSPINSTLEFISTSIVTPVSAAANMNITSKPHKPKPDATYGKHLPVHDQWDRKDAGLEKPPPPPTTNTMSSTSTIANLISTEGTKNVTLLSDTLPLPASLSNQSVVTVQANQSVITVQTNPEFNESESMYSITESISITPQTPAVKSETTKATDKANTLSLELTSNILHEDKTNKELTNDNNASSSINDSTIPLSDEQQLYSNSYTSEATENLSGDLLVTEENLNKNSTYATFVTETDVNVDTTISPSAIANILKEDKPVSKLHITTSLSESITLTNPQVSSSAELSSESESMFPTVLDETKMQEELLPEASSTTTSTQHDKENYTFMQISAKDNDSVDASKSSVNCSGIKPSDTAGNKQEHEASARTHKKPDTFNNQTEEPQLLLSDLLNKITQLGMTKVHVVYAVMSIIVFLTSLVFLSFLCQNPRELRSKQEEGVKAGGPESKFTSIMVGLTFVLLIFYMIAHLVFSQLYLGLVLQESSHLLYSRGSLLISVFWGIYTFSRATSICCTNGFRPATMLIVDFSCCILSLVTLSIFGSHIESLLWCCVAVMSIGLSSIFPYCLLWLEDYIHISNKTMCIILLGSAAVDLVLSATFGRPISLSSSTVIYLVLASSIFALLIFGIMWRLATWRGDKYGFSKADMQYHLANQIDEEEDNIEFASGNSSLYLLNGGAHFPLSSWDRKNGNSYIPLQHNKSTWK